MVIEKSKHIINKILHGYISGHIKNMKLLQIAISSCLFCLIVIGNNAFAGTVIYQCLLKNGHTNFSDSPCLNNQKYIQPKKDRKSVEAHAAPTINVAAMSVPVAHNQNYCANLDRLGIKRKFDQMTREANLKYWRTDQTEILKQALKNLNTMKDGELQGC